jgi:hypothetical protein
MAMLSWGIANPIGSNDSKVLDVKTASFGKTKAGIIRDLNSGLGLNVTTKSTIGFIKTGENATTNAGVFDGIRINF